MSQGEPRIPLDIMVEMFRRLPSTEVKVRVIVDTTAEIFPLARSVAEYVEKRSRSVRVETRSLPYIGKLREPKER